MRVDVLYVISVLLTAAGVVGVFLLLLRVAAPVRRLAETAQRSRAHLADRTGLLAVHVVALRVASDRRRRRSNAG